MENTSYKKLETDIEKVYEDYFSMFGTLPPMSLDSDFYVPQKTNELKAAIATGRPLNG